MDYSGQRILNYKTTRLIAEGGMASVYEAVHQTFQNRKAAIKILAPALFRNQELRKRFINEARIMALLDHENIVKVWDFEELPGRFSIVMEYLEGKTLNEYIAKKGRLSPGEVKTLMLSLLDAFTYAHQKGFVHRDVKPSNIFIPKSNTPKILDFGIAKAFSDKIEQTSTGVLMGTLSYMSPEQVLGDTNIDFRTDIYSLGVLMYYLVSGKKLYDSDTLNDFEIRKAIVESPFPDLSNGFPFGEIIKKACSKNKDERYQSCAAFRHDLLQFENDESNFDFQEKTEDFDDEQTLIFNTEENENLSFDKNIDEPTVFLGGENKFIEDNQTKKKHLKLFFNKKIALLLAVFSIAIVGLFLWQPWTKTLDIEQEKTKAFSTEPLISYVESVRGVAFRMVGVRGGTFEMGSPDDEKERQKDEILHEVNISSFYIGQIEVTQHLWEAVMQSNPSYFKASDHPVEQVSWNDAQRFIKKLNQLTGKNYRLPYSAEWEYACRAKSQSQFNTGNCLSSEQANFDGRNPYLDCSKGIFNQSTQAVASFTANGNGLFDMHGNVSEWCEDWYNENYYANSPKNNPQGPTQGDKKIRRGGGWINNGKHCRSAYQGKSKPDYKHQSLGFRLACSVQ